MFLGGASFIPLQKIAKTGAFAQLLSSNIATVQKPSLASTGASGLSLTTINVGDNQSSIAVNPNTNKVYVTLLDKPILSVIDGYTNKIIENITVGKIPSSVVAVNPTTNMIYVANHEKMAIVINGYTNNIVTTIHLSSPPSAFMYHVVI